MCEIPKMPKIYDYNRDKMVIKQNEVVWNQKHRGMILLCSEFRYHSENTRHREIQIFAMHSNFRYDSEFLL